MDSDLSAIRDQAMRKTRSEVSKKARDIRDNLQEVRSAAHDVAAAGSSADLAPRCSRLLNVLLTGEPARIAARLMIVSYYINLVYTAVETYNILSTAEGAAGVRRWRDDGADRQMPYPLLYVVGLLPVSVMAGAGIVVPWLFSGILFVFTLFKDAWITWVHIKACFRRTGLPSELLMKQLALIGAAALLLAHSCKDSPQLRRVTAGLLRGDDDKPSRPGIRRSTLLLLGRLLLAALMLYAGYNQMLRIRNRAEAAKFAPTSGKPSPTHHHYGRVDPHDNAWLLVECILAIPLALGLFTTGVTRLLGAVLLIEAVTQWGWWGSGWPSWHYRQHIRDHFFLNLSVAGGLLLMQSMRVGGGMFAVDSLLAKKD